MPGQPCFGAANQTRTDSFVFLNTPTRMPACTVSTFPAISRSPRPPAGWHLHRQRYAELRSWQDSQRHRDDDLYNIMPLNAKLSVAHQLGNWNSTAEVVLVDNKKDVSQERNELKTAGYGLLNLRTSYTWKQGPLRPWRRQRLRPPLLPPSRRRHVGQGTTMPPLHANSPYGISARHGPLCSRWHEHQVLS